jgi:hypothetical protein
LPTPAVPVSVTSRRLAHKRLSVRISAWRPIKLDVVAGRPAERRSWAPFATSGTADARANPSSATRTSEGLLSRCSPRSQRATVLALMPSVAALGN